MPTPDQWDQFWSMGDCNRDGYINYEDLYILAKSYGKSVGDPLYDARADFDQNGVVNYLDQYVQAKNYGSNIWDYFGIPKVEPLVLDLPTIAGVGLAIADLALVGIYIGQTYLGLELPRW